MEFEKVLLKRRSIRKYKQDKVEDEKIEKILHMAFAGPSACNKMPLEVYVIKNEEVLEKLCSSIRFANIKSSLAIVVCGNTKKALPLQLKDYYLMDGAAMTENILLEATNLGLGSLWCGVFPEKKKIQKIQEILNLEEHIVPMSLIKLGYSDEETEERDQYNLKKIHFID